MFTGYLTISFSDEEPPSIMIEIEKAVMMTKACVHRAIEITRVVSVGGFRIVPIAAASPHVIFETLMHELSRIDWLRYDAVNVTYYSSDVHTAEIGQLCVVRPRATCTNGTCARCSPCTTTPSKTAKEKGIP